MIGKGQFLMASVLIDQGHLIPERMIIDHNTGAKVPHYAAHYGNVKFFRWMVSHYAKTMDPEEISSFFNSMLDFYKCTVSHYAVRQGHLPLLMYLTDVLKISMYERDQFGYTILDYSLAYKKLYCFIYLYYRCGFKQITSALIPKILDALLESNDKPSNQILQLMMREEDLRESVGPLLMLAAIRNSRLDVVEDVYENCIYLPQMAMKDKSTVNLSKCINKTQLQQILDQVENLTHLDLNKKEKLAKILNGRASAKKFETGKSNFESCFRSLVLVFLCLSFCLVVVLQTIIMTEKLPVRYSKDELLELVDPHKMLKEREIFKGFFIGVAVLLMLELLSLLFIIGREAPVNKKPYLRGNAMEVMASHMNIKKRSSLTLLDSKFDEVCFKCL